MIRLFTTIYPEKNPARMAEYGECLGSNLEGGLYDEVCVLCEGGREALSGHPRLRLRQIARRPNYDDFFSWINELATGDCLSVIANTDICFTASLNPAVSALGVRDCLALARWDPASDGKLVLFDRNDSQDAWAFRGRVTGVRGDFPPGVARCDNRILYELQTAGYRVMNPAFSVRIVHLHSGVREEYGPNNLPHFVEPPYRYLWPHNLWSLPRTLWHNLLHPGERVGWRFDRRRASRWFAVRAVRKLTAILRAQSRTLPGR